MQKFWINGDIHDVYSIIKRKNDYICLIRGTKARKISTFIKRNSMLLYHDYDAIPHLPQKINKEYEWLVTEHTPKPAASNDKAFNLRFMLDAKLNIKT